MVSTNHLLLAALGASTVSAGSQINPHHHRLHRIRPLYSRNVTSVASGILDFGSCTDPSIVFGAGFDGRKEDSFEPANKTQFTHGSALNIVVITDFICDRFEDTCHASSAAQSACIVAQAAAIEQTGQAAADAWNSALGLRNTTVLSSISTGSTSSVSAASTSEAAAPSSSAPIVNTCGSPPVGAGSAESSTGGSTTTGHSTGAGSSTGAGAEAGNGSNDVSANGNGDASGSSSSGSSSSGSSQSGTATDSSKSSGSASNGSDRSGDTGGSSTSSQEKGTSDSSSSVSGSTSTATSSGSTSGASSGLQEGTGDNSSGKGSAQGSGNSSAQGSGKGSGDSKSTISADATTTAASSTGTGTGTGNGGNHGGGNGANNGKGSGKGNGKGSGRGSGGGNSSPFSNSTTTTGTDNSTTTASAATSTATNSTTNLATNSTTNSTSSSNSSSLFLLSANVQNASDSSGFANPEKGQAPSATDPANFINVCTGKTLTNGLQVKAGSCNGIVMGDIPASTNMVSTIITFPQSMQTVVANSTFNITLQVKNLEAGSFTNPDVTYYSSPQALKGGNVVGHTHVTVQSLGKSLVPTAPPDPSVFVFFKGINNAGDGKGGLSATVTGGLPPGFYRCCTMGSSSNHQPLLMPVAQRGAQDDCQKFEVK